MLLNHRIIDKNRVYIIIYNWIKYIYWFKMGANIAISFNFF